MVTFQDKLQVLTAPADILPLDIINSEDVNRILEVARTHYDYVVIDMPHTMVQWTEAVIHASHVYFALMEMDMRSAQNALRTIRAFKGEELPVEKMRYVINRGPGMTDLTGKSRIKRLAESLDIAIELQLPDGGKQILTACDNGTPLADVAAKNPLRKEIQKLALSVHALNQSVSTKAA
jgi:pilus assembly protein CpaE